MLKLFIFSRVLLKTEQLLLCTNVNLLSFGISLPKTRCFVTYITGSIRTSPVSSQFLWKQLNGIDSRRNKSSTIDTNMADNKFQAEYAPTARSSCKKCKQKIDKGELRVNKLTANIFHEGEGEMKQSYHPKCLFDTFIRARSTTKIVEEPDDLEGYSDLKQEDKDTLKKLIQETLDQKSSPSKKPKKAVQTTLPFPVETAKTSPNKAEPAKPAAKAEPDDATNDSGDKHADKDNSFRNFRCLCADIAEENSYLGKTKIVSDYISRGASGNGFQGDIFLLFKLLLPSVVKTVYNINSKQLVKLFSDVFGQDQDEMLTHLEQGDVAETVRVFFEQSTVLPPQKKSVLSLQDVDDFLEKLSKLTKENEQMSALRAIAKKCTGNDLKMVVRLIKHDLRINAGAKHILDALDPNAYEAFRASRNLKDVVEKVVKLKSANSNGTSGLKKELSIRASLMTPVSPMLAEACRSVAYAFKKCPNGIFAEIKYDGERVQVHKQGSTFSFFSRSLKPVQQHKVKHFQDIITKAFPKAADLVLDSEVLLIDTLTGLPLPFGSLGVHKKTAFTDANVCLFVFDCLHVNGENLMTKPFNERRKVLTETMTAIPNHIMFSEITPITTEDELKTLMTSVFKKGLEGLVLKDANSIYEPGKRHWLKVKKDYLAGGAMADTADLVVLGAYYGTGNKGGIMSTLLMGVYDPDTRKWLTVTKCCNGLDDKTLQKLQTELDMVKISKDSTKVPAWLSVTSGLVPDFVVKDPKEAQVWEITGAEFTKSQAHTAAGISIRFPRFTKRRDDKTWKEATSLAELKDLMSKSKESFEFPELVDDVPGKKTRRGEGEGSPLKGVKRKQSQRDAGSDEDAEQSDTEREDSDNDDGNSSSRNGSPAKRARLDPQKVKASPSPVKKAVASNKVANFGLKGLPDVFTSLKFFLRSSTKKYDELKRFIISYNGEVVDEVAKSDATHVVSDSAENVKGKAKVVSTKWLWQCIKKKKLVST